MPVTFRYTYEELILLYFTEATRTKPRARIPASIFRSATERQKDEKKRAKKFQDIIKNGDGSIQIVTGSKKKKNKSKKAKAKGKEEENVAGGQNQLTAETSSSPSREEWGTPFSEKQLPTHSPGHHHPYAPDKFGSPSPPGSGLSSSDTTHSRPAPVVIPPNTAPAPTPSAGPVGSAIEPSNAAGTSEKRNEGVVASFWIGRETIAKPGNYSNESAERLLQHIKSQKSQGEDPAELARVVLNAATAVNLAPRDDYARRVYNLAAREFAREDKQREKHLRQLEHNLGRIPEGLLPEATNTSHIAHGNTGSNSTTSSTTTTTGGGGHQPSPIFGCLTTQKPGLQVCSAAMSGYTNSTSNTTEFFEKTLGMVPGAGTTEQLQKTTLEANDDDDLFRLWKGATHAQRNRQRDVLHRVENILWRLNNISPKDRKPQYNFSGGIQVSLDSTNGLGVWHGGENLNEDPPPTNGTAAVSTTPTNHLLSPTTDCNSTYATDGNSTLTEVTGSDFTGDIRSTTDVDSEDRPAVTATTLMLCNTIQWGEMNVIPTTGDVFSYTDDIDDTAPPTLPDASVVGSLHSIPTAPLVQMDNTINLHIPPPNWLQEDSRILPTQNPGKAATSGPGDTPEGALVAHPIVVLGLKEDDDEEEGTSEAQTPLELSFSGVDLMKECPVEEMNGTEVDIVADGSLLRDIFMAPYTAKPLFVRANNIEGKLVLEKVERKATKKQRKLEAAEKELFSKFVYHSVLAADDYDRKMRRAVRMATRERSKSQPPKQESGLRPHGFKIHRSRSLEAGLDNLTETKEREKDKDINKDADSSKDVPQQGNKDSNTGGVSNTSNISSVAYDAASGCGSLNTDNTSNKGTQDSIFPPYSAGCGATAPSVDTSTGSDEEAVDLANDPSASMTDEEDSGLPTGAGLPDLCTTTTTAVPSSVLKTKFSKVLHWQLKELNLLVGTDLFTMRTTPDEHAEEACMRLRSVGDELDTESVMEYWLDNVMCNIPQLVICCHKDGLVSDYQITPTSELPNMKDLEFEPAIIQDYGCDALRWLREKCCGDEQSYILEKEPNSRILKLRELSEQEDGPDSHVGMLCYHMGEGLKCSSNKLSQQRRARSLFERAANFLSKNSESDYLAKVYAYIAETYVAEAQSSLLSATAMQATDGTDQQELPTVENPEDQTIDELAVLYTTALENFQKAASFVECCENATEIRRITRQEVGCCYELSKTAVERGDIGTLFWWTTRAFAAMDWYLNKFGGGVSWADEMDDVKLDETLGSSLHILDREKEEKEDIEWRTTATADFVELLGDIHYARAQNAALLDKTADQRKIDKALKKWQNECNDDHLAILRPVASLTTDPQHNYRRTAKFYQFINISRLAPEKHERVAKSLIECVGKAIAKQPRIYEEALQALEQAENKELETDLHQKLAELYSHLAQRPQEQEKREIHLRRCIQHYSAVLQYLSGTSDSSSETPPPCPHTNPQKFTHIASCSECERSVCKECSEQLTQRREQETGQSLLSTQDNVGRSKLELAVLLKGKELARGAHPKDAPTKHQAVDLLREVVDHAHAACTWSTASKAYAQLAEITAEWDAPLPPPKPTRIRPSSSGGNNVGMHGANKWVGAGGGGMYGMGHHGQHHHHHQRHHQQHHQHHHHQQQHHIMNRNLGLHGHHLMHSGGPHSHPTPPNMVGGIPNDLQQLDPYKPTITISGGLPVPLNPGRDQRGHNNYGGGGIMIGGNTGVPAAAPPVVGATGSGSPAGSLSGASSTHSTPPLHPAAPPPPVPTLSSGHVPIALVGNPTGNCGGGMMPPPSTGAPIGPPPTAYDLSQTQRVGPAVPTPPPVPLMNFAGPPAGAAAGGQQNMGVQQQQQQGPPTGPQQGQQHQMQSIPQQQLALGQIVPPGQMHTPVLATGLGGPPPPVPNNNPGGGPPNPESVAHMAPMSMANWAPQPPPPPSPTNPTIVTPFHNAHPPAPPSGHAGNQMKMGNKGRRGDYMY